jgi:hypothetical protein
MWGSCESRGGLRSDRPHEFRPGGFSDGVVCSDSAASTDQSSLEDS